MNKKILKQLHSLETIAPDPAWKANYRDVLYNQIKNSSLQNIERKPGVLIIFRRVYSYIAQPTFAVIAVIVLALGFFSMTYASSSMPGDSMYIAKKISQKAQLAVTFDEDKKSKLGAKFANTNAKEITKVLSDPSFHEDGANQVKVEKLSRQFKEEIDIVKNSISYLKNNEQSAIIKDTSRTEDEDELETGEDIVDDAQLNEDDIDDNQVFTAGSGKENDGLEIYEPDTSVDNRPEIVEGDATVIEGVDLNTALAQTPASEGAEKILEEAQVLFDEHDYDGALVKLEELDAAINESESDANNEDVTSIDEDATDNNQSEVDSIEETASSTE